MKSQFDPDVWAALFMIMIIGFGGITFMSMFVNGMTMHGLLSIFDQEFDQRCDYFLIPVISNDYALIDETPNKDINYTANYLQVSHPERQTYFNDFMKEVNKTMYNHGRGYDFGGNQTVKSVCWALGDQLEVSKKIKSCEQNSKYKVLIMSCNAIVYGPAGIGEAEVDFVG